MTNWYEVQGKSTQADFWSAPMWEGKPRFGPILLPDGRQVVRVLAAEGTSAIPFPIWFQQHPDGGKRLGDILWSAGLSIKIVSQRFVDRLRELDVHSFQTYDIELWDRRKKHRIEGYVGFIEDQTGEGEIKINPVAGGKVTLSMICTERVLHGLLEAGIDQFDREAFSNFGSK
ncbi:MAG: hypothetical protein ACK5LO_17455 [Leucobacter sp.]